MFQQWLKVIVVPYLSQIQDMAPLALSLQRRTVQVFVMVPHTSDVPAGPPALIVHLANIVSILVSSNVHLVQLRTPQVVTLAVIAHTLARLDTLLHLTVALDIMQLVQQNPKIKMFQHVLLQQINVINVLLRHAAIMDCTLLVNQVCTVAQSAKIQD